MIGIFARKDPSASEYVSVTSIARRPVAIVVLLGWMGASEKELQEYGSLYHDLQCSTVCATAPTMSLAIHDTTTLGELAITAIRETCRLVRRGEWSEMACGHVPILLHVLSHGGALLLEEMERRIREVVASTAFDIMSDEYSTFSFGGRPMTTSTSTVPLTSSETIATSGASIANENPHLVSKGKCSHLALVGKPVIPSAARFTLSTRSLTSSSVSSLEDPTDDDLIRPGRDPLLKLSLIQQPGPILAQSQSPRRRRRKRRPPVVKRFDKERNTTLKEEPAYNSDEHAYRRDMQLFASRLAVGAIVFDSAPFFPSLQQELLAAEICMGSDVIMKIAVQSAITSQQSLHRMLQYSSIGNFTSTTNEIIEASRQEQFWRNMQELSLTKRHGYVYGDSDKVCDPWTIKYLIFLQRGRGINVSECRVRDSKHLEHKRRRHDLYTEFLAEILDSVCHTMIGQETDDEWCPDTAVEHGVGEKFLKEKLNKMLITDL